MKESLPGVTPLSAYVQYVMSCEYGFETDLKNKTRNYKQYNIHGLNKEEAAAKLHGVNKLCVSMKLVTMSQ